MKAIVAVDQNWGIGRAGALLCPIRADLRRFKALTMGHPVILGRKTLATFPGSRPLPGRPNLVLSRNPEFTCEGAQVFRDLDSLRAAAPDDSMVIGGESVYRAPLDECDTVYVPKTLSSFEADAFFPNLDNHPDWQVSEEAEELEENGVRFRYVTYKRV